MKLTKKKTQKLDLLKLSDVERIKLMKRLQEVLRQKVAEAKLWQSFVETDNVTVNGIEVHCSETSLKGISLSELFRNT